MLAKRYRDVTELETLLRSYEINRRTLSREVGKCDDWLTVSFKHRAQASTLQPLLARIEAKGHRLLHFKFSKHNLNTTMKVCGLKMSWLAKQMGISRQGLYKGIEEGLASDRQAQIESVLHSTGQALIDVAEKLKK